jgi:hypothetical protein
MTLSAYEAAKVSCATSGIATRCWYLNTARTRVIPLVGEGCDEHIFTIDVEDYATAYSRSLVAGDLEDQRRYSEHYWLPFAQTLAKNPAFAALIKEVMSKITNNRPGKLAPKFYTLKNLPTETYELLEEAQRMDIVSQLKSNSDSSVSFQLSYLQDRFLNGAWLEAYVWDAAKHLWDEERGKALFDDCQWNQRVDDGNSKNELDVAMTYKAQLLIAECKTEEDPFSSTTLYKLDSVANILGGRFVGRLLITSTSKEKPSEDFLAQAKSRRIVVVTGDRLPDIATILKNEAIDSPFPRI